MAIYDSTYVYSSTINAALGSCFFGYVNSVLNPLQAFLQLNIYPTISKDLIYLMTSLVPAGAAIGAITAGSLALKFGRKKSLFFTDAISILAIIFTLFHSQYALLIGRLISGFCVGLNSSLVPLYISEMSPVEAKGTTGTFTQIAISIGILLAYIFGLFVPSGSGHSDNYWWAFMLGFPILLAVVRSSLLFFKFNHETPKYLMLKGSEDKAIRVLEKIYSRQARSEQLVLLRKERQGEAQAGKVTYADLFSFRYSRRLRVGCFIAILQQLSGINAIIYYSTTIFSANLTDPNSKMPQVYTMIVGILNLMSAFFATCLIGRMGRRKLLLTGTTILFWSLILLPITNLISPDSTWISKFFIFLFILGFGFSLGSVSWIYISEILPDIGIGLAILLSWCSCVFVAQSFPYLIEYAGLNGTFFLFACFNFIGIILIQRWVLETKGKMSHEIAAMFMQRQDFNIEQQTLSKPDSQEL